jgi:DNA-binding transcriptional ArsR family regulator
LADPPPTVGTPSLLRAINARAILERIQHTGPVSRAQVARDSGLSKPTVSLGLSALLDAGLVREVGRSSGRPGPSAVLYELNPAAGWVIGIDVGRRRVRAALADITGAVVARRDERAQASSARALIGQIGSIAHGLAAQAGIGWDRVHHVTVGSPGVFEPIRGAVTLAPNLPGWGRQGLVAALRDELGGRIGVENDVNLAAEGERWRGLGQDVQNFGFLSVGTGVGMAWCWTASCTGASAGPPARSATCPSAPTPTTPRSAAGARSRRRSTAPRWSAPPARPAYQGRSARRRSSPWPAGATRWPGGWSVTRRGASPPASPWSWRWSTWS